MEHIFSNSGVLTAVFFIILLGFFQQLSQSLPFDFLKKNINRIEDVKTRRKITFLIWGGSVLIVIFIMCALYPIMYNNPFEVKVDTTSVGLGLGLDVNFDGDVGKVTVTEPIKSREQANREQANKEQANKEVAAINVEKVKLLFGETKILFNSELSITAAKRHFRPFNGTVDLIVKKNNDFKGTYYKKWYYSKTAKENLEYNNYTIKIIEVLKGDNKFEQSVILYVKKSIDKQSSGE